MQERVKSAATPMAHVALKARGSKSPRPSTMNKTERKYSLHLETEKRAGRIHDYKYEAVKLRLADATFLTMDFFVMDCDGFVEFHDTKALWKSTGKPHVNEDAQIKMKVAAQHYPGFKFMIVWEEGGVWKRREY